MKIVFVSIGLLTTLAFPMQAQAEEIEVHWHEPTAADVAPDLTRQPPGLAIVLERGQFSHRRYGRSHGGEGIWRLQLVGGEEFTFGLYAGLRSFDRLEHYSGIGSRKFLLGFSINPLGGLHLLELIPKLDLFLLGPRTHVEVGWTPDEDDLTTSFGAGITPLGLRATWCASVCPFFEFRAVEVTWIANLIDEDDTLSVNHVAIGVSMGTGFGF